MNKPFRALLSLCLMLTVTLCPITGSNATSTASLDYSVAEKLFKQLEAGSGFSGTLSLSLTANTGRESDALTTNAPLVFDFTYITVREDASTNTPGERRYELLYPAGDDAAASVFVSAQDESTYLKSSFLEETWYKLGETQSASGEEDTSPLNDAQQSVGNLSTGIDDLLSQTSMPSLFSFFLPLLLDSQGSASANLSDALNTYATKIDLWIEGYRQNTVLGKLKDGTTTMEVTYAIPPAAIKAQLKQMVLDLLSDSAVLSKLQAFLPEDQAELMLNPLMQNFYFFAIDELPLEDQLLISRTVSLKGDTVALHLQLPLYDKQAGAVVITYDRKAGEGDLPDENIVSLESEDLTLHLEYQEYSTMTDVTVYQGTLLREPHGIASYEVDSGAVGLMQKTLSLSFTLTHQQIAGVDAEERETLAHDFQLTMEPLLSATDENGEAIPISEEAKDTYYIFPAFDARLNATFASKQAKNAATSMDLLLTVSGEDIPQTLDVSFSGKTKAKWTPEPINTANLPDLFEMDIMEFAQLLVKASHQAELVFLPQFHLPEAQEADADTADTDAPSNTDTPAVSLQPSSTSPAP